MMAPPSNVILTEQKSRRVRGRNINVAIAYSRRRVKDTMVRPLTMMRSTLAVGQLFFQLT